MRPRITLRRDLVRHNARVYARRARIPLRAVVKADGYGWGMRAMVDALDDLVAGYCVSDVDEFRQLRVLTALPIVLFGDVAAPLVAGVLDGGGLPNLTTVEGIDAAIAWARVRGRSARVRIGVRPAVGWFGFSSVELAALAGRLASPALEIELWTHVTDPVTADEEQRSFARVLEALRAQGVRVAATDVASSGAVAAASGPRGALRDATFVRVGIGLFGARLGGDVPARCAVSLRALVVQRLEARPGLRVGYGALRSPESGYLVVVRCGYSDGLPKALTQTSDIVSVGMQYTVLERPEDTAVGSEIELLHESSDLDRICQSAGISPHEFIVRLGRSRGDEDPRPPHEVLVPECSQLRTPSRNSTCA